MRKAQVTALVALLVASVTAGAGSSAGDKPTLRLIRLTPVTVRAANFVPSEKVKVTLRAGSVERVRHVRTSATGRFFATFGTLREKDRCGTAMTLVAIGGRGGRAVYKLPPRECPVGATHPAVGFDRTVFKKGDIDPGLAPFIDIAVVDLAGRLRIAEAAIEVLTAVLVVWSDAGLGCAEPDRAYAQIPQDGSLIELAAGGKVYRYHSGGRRGPFLCEQPLVQKPGRRGPNLRGGGGA